jgi:hypothetical protein
MSPEELRERLNRAGFTPHRLSHLLGVDPNEGSKWTRGARPIPKGRVAQIVELTDFAAERGTAALGQPADARPRLVRPVVTRPKPVVSPPEELRTETRAGFGPLHSDFVNAHNAASQSGVRRWP